MRSGALVLMSIALAAGAQSTAEAQSDGDFAAWAAIMLTPAGAFTPVVVAPAMKDGERLPVFLVRGGTWKLEGGRSNYTFGGTMAAPIFRRATLSATVGYFKPGCDPGVNCDGTLMAGADLEAPVVERVVSQATSRTVLNARLKGSLGYGKFMGGTESNLFSAVASVPLSARRDMTNSGSLSAFISPGIGYGKVSENLQPSQSGSRPLMGGGVAWTTADGIGLHLGAQRIFLEAGSATLWGAALSFAPGNDVRIRRP